MHIVWKNNHDHDFFHTMYMIFLSYLSENFWKNKIEKIM